MTASKPAKYRTGDQPAADVNIRDSDGSVWLLYRGIKSILRCDGAEVVNGIARYVVTQRRGLRILSAVLEQTRGSFFPIFVALIGGFRSFLEVDAQSVPAGEKRTAVWIARLGNERRAIDMLPGLVPLLNWVELKFRL